MTGSERLRVDPAPESGPPSPSWQPLPDAARLIYRLGSAAAALGVAIGVLLVPFVGLIERADPLAAGAILAFVATVALALGAWVGGRRHGRISVRLDADGLHVRRGLCWRSETLVPANRVQHIDLERGPLLRRRGLATLVVHTAGTRHNAVRVVGLELATARSLRQALVDGEGGDDDAV